MTDITTITCITYDCQTEQVDIDFFSFNVKMFELNEGRTLLPLYLTLLLVLLCDFVLPGGNYSLFWTSVMFSQLGYHLR